MIAVVFLAKADLDGHGWWDKLKNYLGDTECWCEGKKAEEAAKKNLERVDVPRNPAHSKPRTWCSRQRWI
jgi:hypothetical protein